MQIPDDEFFDYLRGKLAPDRAREIKQAAQNDPELKARIDIMREFLECPAPQDGSVQEEHVELSRAHFDRGNTIVDGEGRRVTLRTVPTSKLWRLNKRSVTVAIVILCATTLLGAGWITLINRPLLSDNFNSNWFDPDHWQRPPDHIQHSGVVVQDKVLRLINRGYLITHHEFPGPIDLSFDWKWINHALNPVYADHLTVVLRTNGAARQEYSHEAASGIRIKIDAWGGNLVVTRSSDEHKFVSPLTSVIPLPSDVWHSIRITDDGTRIQVFILTQGAPAPDTSRPLLSVEVPSEPGARQIAMYNREYVGDTLHESWIDNVVVRRLHADSK